MGFEPTEPCDSPIFKTGAFNHSATHPGTRKSTKNHGISCCMCCTPSPLLFRRPVQKSQCVSVIVVGRFVPFLNHRRDHRIFASVALAGGVQLDGPHRHPAIWYLLCLTPRCQMGKETPINLGCCCAGMSTDLLEKHHCNASVAQLLQMLPEPHEGHAAALEPSRLEIGDPMDYLPGWIPYRPPGAGAEVKGKNALGTLWT